MAHIFWDASALSKRYYSEAGQDTVNAVFAHVSSFSMTVTYLGYVETAAILLRKRNGRLLSPIQFTDARRALQQQTLGTPDFGFLLLDETDYLNAIAFVDRHNLNASDAAILAGFVRLAQSISETYFLLASDRRLLRAARVEGLHTLNPETISAADVPALLS